MVGILLTTAGTFGHTQAPTVVPGSSGIQFRYHGDTIWRERDTTATQSIYRRDTLYRDTFVLGRKTRSQVFVILGDSARVVETRDALGKIVETGQNKVSSVSVEVDRALLESAVEALQRETTARAFEERMRESNARAQANGFPTRTLPTTPSVPLSPATKQTYPWSADRKLEQLGDTVRYIKGCTVRPPVDTTVYLLFGTDSVRRLSPAPRTFDTMMAQAVRADINSVALRQRVRPADNPAMRDVPKLNKWPCDER